MSVRNLSDALRWTSYFSVSRDANGVAKDVYINPNGAIHADSKKRVSLTGDSMFHNDPAGNQNSEVQRSREDNGLSGTPPSSLDISDDSVESSSNREKRLQKERQQPPEATSRRSGSADYRFAFKTPRDESTQHASAPRRKASERLETALDFESEGEFRSKASGGSKGKSRSGSCSFKASLGGGGALFTPVVQYISRTSSATGANGRNSEASTPFKRPSTVRPQSSPSDARGMPQSGATHRSNSACARGEKKSSTTHDDEDNVGTAVHVHIHREATEGAHHNATRKPLKPTDDNKKARKIKKVLLYNQGAGEGRESKRTSSVAGSSRYGSQNANGLGGSGSSIGAATRAAAAAALVASMGSSHVKPTTLSPTGAASPVFRSSGSFHGNPSSSSKQGGGGNSGGLGLPPKSKRFGNAHTAKRDKAQRRRESSSSRSVSSDSATSCESECTSRSRSPSTPRPSSAAPKESSSTTARPSSAAPKESSSTTPRPSSTGSKDSSTTSRLSSAAPKESSSTTARPSSAAPKESSSTTTSSPLSSDAPTLKRETRGAEADATRPSPPSPPPRRFSSAPNFKDASEEQRTNPDFYLRQRAQLLREEGNECFRRSDFSTAVRLYSQALSLDCFNEVILCNRSAAYCGAFNYTAALVDAKFAILVAPHHVKGYWRAGKALLALNKLDEARHYYSLALEESEKESTGEDASKSSKQDVATLRKELDAINVAERYAGHMKASRWAEAVLCSTELLKVFRSGPSTMMSFTINNLEAKLYTDPQHVLQETQKLLDEHVECPGLLYLLAKAVFYCAHDEESTKKTLNMLQSEREHLSFQDNIVSRNIEELAHRIQKLPHVSPNFDEIEWKIRFKVLPSEASEQLLRCVRQFTKYRDEGNRAYLMSEWATAHAAYTQCLSLDKHNRSLTAATYCNRAAVAIQQERWKDALSDCTSALQLQPQNGKAYARRARVYMRFYKEFADNKSDAVYTKLLHYISAAVEDLKKAVAHSPSSPRVSSAGGSGSSLKEQLRQALETRQQLLETHKQTDTFDYRSSFAHGDGCGSGSGFTGTSGSRSSYEYFGRGAKGRTEPKYTTYDDEEPPRRATGGGYRTSSGGTGYRPSSGASYFSGSSSYCSGGGARTRSSYGSARASGSPTAEQHLRRLGLSGKPDMKTISKAYRERALQWHPDKWSGKGEAERLDAEKNFKEINMAYQALKETFTQP